MFKVRSILDESSFYSLQSIWNPLLVKSQCNSFFLTWEWVSTWWEVYGIHYSLNILVAENDNQEVVGIAPLMVGKGHGKGSQFQRRLMFIGQDTDVTPEYLDFIICINLEAEVVDLFAQTLVQTSCLAWDILFFQRVLQSSVCMNLFSSILRKHGVEMKTHNEVICRYAALDNSWDEYLKSKSQHFRKRWNNTRNRLINEGEITCKFVPQDVPLEETYNKLVELNQERWGEQGASFRSDAYIRFHRLLCQKIEPRGWLILVKMIQNDKVIAAKYDYLYAGKMWGNQGGWSKEFQKKKVGEILIGKLLEWGTEKGIKEYDFLGGDVEYKERWGTAYRMMSDWTAYNNTFRGNAWHWAALVKVWLRDNLPKRVLDKLKGIKSFSTNHVNL